MPDVAGLRGIALGTPAGTLAFDSERCVLTAAWTGFAEIGGWFDNGRMRRSTML
jgi:hypothetical protein